MHEKTCVIPIIFPKILIGQSLLTVSLSKIHRQNLKNNIIFFKRNKEYFESADKIKQLEFFSTFRKITVGRFVNQLIKKFWPYPE